jgi:hypothetical protein
MRGAKFCSYGELRRDLICEPHVAVRPVGSDYILSRWFPMDGRLQALSKGSSGQICCDIVTGRTRRGFRGVTPSQRLATPLLQNPMESRVRMGEQLEAPHSRPGVNLMVLWAEYREPRYADTGTPVMLIAPKLQGNPRAVTVGLGAVARSCDSAANQDVCLQLPPLRCNNVGIILFAYFIFLLGI